MLGGITREEEQKIKLFKKSVKEKFPLEVKEIFLYGSKARGNYHDESDIDLLVITESDDWKLADEIRRIGYSLDAEIGYSFSILVIPEARFRYMQENRFQFALNILSDAVEI